MPPARRRSLSKQYQLLPLRRLVGMLQGPQDPHSPVATHKDPMHLLLSHSRDMPPRLCLRRCLLQEHLLRDRPTKGGRRASILLFIPRDPEPPWVCHHQSWRHQVKRTEKRKEGALAAQKAIGGRACLRPHRCREPIAIYPDLMLEAPPRPHPGSRPQALHSVSSRRRNMLRDPLHRAPRLSNHPPEHKPAPPA